MTAACPRCGSTENLDTYGVCDGPCPTGADDRPHMMQSVWPSTPGTATHALEDDPDPTRSDDLAARLESTDPSVDRLPDGTTVPHEAEVLAHRAPDGTVILEVKRPGGWVRVSLPLLEQMTADLNRVRKIEQENIRLRRKLNAVIDWTEATSEDEDDSDWPLTTHEPYAAAQNRVHSIIEEER